MGIDFDRFVEGIEEMEAFRNEDHTVEVANVTYDEEEVASAIETIIDIVPERLTKVRARRETKEMIREELAKYSQLQKVFNNAVDHHREVPRTVNGETLCLQLSDWHFGKNTVIDGKPAFNSDIAYDRVANVMAPQIVEHIKTLGRTNHIEDVQIFMLGDMIENDIMYETQRLHIDKPVSAQFNDCMKAIMVLLGAITGAFADIGKPDIPIKIDGITGNHGRAHGKQDTGECSWDTALYMAVETALQYSELKNISIDYSFEQYKVVDIRGQKGLLRHWAPSQAETGGAKAKFGGWNEIFDFDFLCYGHYHHWGINTYHGKPLFRNGSLCGTDDYALNLAVADDWGQLMWGCNKDDPCTFIHRIR
jgi:calcineurin-like phosphoesterase family protein